MSTGVPPAYCLKHELLGGVLASGKVVNEQLVAVVRYQTLKFVAILHCASTANVGKPLPLVATGTDGDWGIAVGVAQTYGVICVPARTGPPIGWLVMVSDAFGRPRPLPLASATNSFSPTRRPVSTPRMVRAAASVRKCAVTSWPLRSSVTWCRGTVFGTLTSTRASPSLIKSARLFTVTMSKLVRGRSGLAKAGKAAARHAHATATAEMRACNVIWTSPLEVSRV